MSEMSDLGITNVRSFALFFQLFALISICWVKTQPTHSKVLKVPFLEF